MNQTKKIVIITAKSSKFSFILGVLGAAAITDFGLDRELDQIKIVALVDQTKIDGFTLTGLPDDSTIKMRFEDIDEDGTIKSRLKSKYARVGTIERRNGFYAITGDKNLAQSPAFLTVTDQVKDKKAPAFDTAYAHVSGQKNTWIGKTGHNARLAHINATSITGARYGLLGLLFTTDKGEDVQMIDWASLDTWFKKNNGSNLPKSQQIYVGDGNVRSLSHVNGDRLVVNTNNGKTVLDLAALNDQPTAKIVSKDISDLDSNLAGVHPYRMDTAVFVDEITDDTEISATIRFQPVTQLPRELRQDYAQAV